MARINIDTGTAGNPATGDTLRTAMTKINTNFTEVYSLVRDGSSGLIATDVTNGDLKLQANGTGAIEIDTLSITNSTITSITTNSDITLTPNGTGNVVLGNFTFNADQTVGAGQDNYVFTYDHSTGTIGLEAAASGGVTASSTTTFTNKTFDANGTGNSISNIDIADFTSGVFLDEDNMASNSATAIASQQSIKAYVDSQILTKDNTDEITEGSTNLYFTNARADARITNALKDEDNMASDSATHVPSQQSVKAYVDAEDANIASDSMTFTNKAGNISQWTNDSNYATQAYVDARDIGDLAVTGSTISAPSNADLTLTTSGTGVVAIDNLTVDSNINITDNEIKTTTSNSDLKLSASGTGNVNITDSLDVDSITAYSGTNTNLTLAGKGTGYVFVNDRLAVSGNIDLGGDINTSTTTFVSRVDSNIEPDATANNRNLGSSSRKWNTVYASVFDGTVTGTIDADSSTISNLEVDNFKAATIVLESEGIGSNDNDTTIPTSAAVKDYVDNNAGGTTGDLAITGSTISAPSNADLTLNAGGTGSVDIDGIQIKGTSISSTDSTQININENVSIDGTLTVGGASLSGTLNTAGNTGTGSVALASQSLQVTGTTNEINIEAAAFALTASLADNISGIVSVTASSFLANDAIKIIDNKITGTRSNENVELEANGTGGVIAQSPFTFNAGYIEKINTLTSSSTITVDCATASVHKVTLATSTQFNIANLPTGGTVTLIITQDGTGSRTATFGTDGSSAVKFPSNSSTLSTGAADIDVVTIINDGTNFLGNIAKDYRSS